MKGKKDNLFKVKVQWYYLKRILKTNKLLKALTMIKQ